MLPHSDAHARQPATDRRYQQGSVPVGNGRCLVRKCGSASSGARGKSGYGINAAFTIVAVLSCENSEKKRAFCCFVCAGSPATQDFCGTRRFARW
jgi:hypothetical protein